MIIDFDSDDWMPDLDVALEHLVAPATKTALRQSQLQYSSDALDAIAGLSDIEAVIDSTLAWIRSNQVRVFHGTRLTDAEAGCLFRTGLWPLNIADRTKWLRSEFPEIARLLSAERAEEIVREANLAHRENQVHAAISRKLVIDGYDYLLAGSEFDRRLLEYAGHTELVSLLRKRGKPRLVSLLLPGADALEGVHPFFTIDMVRHTDKYPNLVRELLEEYAWHLHDPTGMRYPVDACLHFKKAIPGRYVETVEAVTERVAEETP